MKILILRFSSIGDIVLTTPVARCLKNQIQGSEIHYLTKSAYTALLEPLSYVDRVLSFDKSTGEVVQALRHENYDLIIDLHKNLRSRSLLFRLGRRAHSFPKLNLQKWLRVRFKIDCLPAVHIVDRYFRAVAFAGITNDGAGLDFTIPPETMLPADVFPLPDGAAYTAIVAGAKQFTKQIPEEKIIALCHSLKQTVVLLGGKEEAAKADRIAGAVPAGSLINLCGCLSLQQSALVLKHARNIITADTGLMHISAALKKEVISVWGNTLPAFGMSPYYPAGQEQLGHIVENTTVPCRPCTKLGYERCPKKHFKCMHDIPTEEILRWVK